MSDEPPIEFRAAKSGLSITDWLAGRVRQDAAICTGAAVLLWGCGAAGTLGLFGFLWGVFACGLGKWGALPAAGVVVGLFVIQKRYDGDHVEPVTVDAGPRGTVTLRLSRLTGNSWLMYLERSTGDLNPVVRVATTLALLAPRLIAVGRLMWSRWRRLKAFDVKTVAAGLDVLMQSSNRVAIGDLLQEFPNVEPQRFMNELTAVDGVVLLGSDPPGLTLAPSLAEDYETWKKALRKKRRPAAY